MKSINIYYQHLDQIKIDMDEKKENEMESKHNNDDESVDLFKILMLIL